MPVRILAIVLLVLGCGRERVVVGGGAADRVVVWPLAGVLGEGAPENGWDEDTIPATTAFGREIQALSEPGGYFPSENLVSNETSYQHVLPALVALGVRGGAYIGVGPDQNFTYIAEIEPERAYIVDIRRDNLLCHLLFKAAFELSGNRVEYLALLLGRPLPAEPGAWDGASLDEIVLYMDTVAASMAGFEAADARLLEVVVGMGYPLSDWDVSTVRSIHFALHDRGLGLRYSNDSRRRRYPSWRQLLLQTDLEGRRRSYLSSEERFRRVRRLQRADRIVPVVGDFGGPHALAAVGRAIAERGLVVTAFYVSNVEQYLVRGPGFAAYAQTVAGLPIDERSVFIRSYFARRWPIPQTVPGHFSTQLLERIADFVATEAAGGYLSYLDLVTRNALPLGQPLESVR